MKINHFICPTCGHDFMADCAYATCDACQTFFYAASSRTCKRPVVCTPPIYDAAAIYMLNTIEDD